jgi:hypothetical protein
MNGHKFIPPEPVNACAYVVDLPGNEVACRLPLSHPAHKSHIPPAILHSGRVEASTLQQLNDLQRERLDVMGIILGALPAGLQHLRDGTMGNIVRYYVDEARKVRRLQDDNNDKNDQISRMNRQGEAALKYQNDLQRRLADAERSLTELKRYAEDRLSPPVGMAETDDEGHEVTDVPDAFIQLSMAALERFAEGYAEYGEGAADALGLAGQWGDLHRKVMKLKRSMWHGKGNLTRETEEDVLQDIIGHCYLALEMYSRDFTGGRD